MPPDFFSKNFGVAPHIQNVMEQGKQKSNAKRFLCIEYVNVCNTLK